MAWFCGARQVACFAIVLCSLPCFDTGYAKDKQTGLASFYMQSQKTASGERFSPGDLTAAHRKLPFGTHVVVKNRRTNREVVVRINDRGPYIAGRIIDLSSAAAGAIGMIGRGIEPVELRILLDPWKVPKANAGASAPPASAAHPEDLQTQHIGSE